MWTMGSGGSHHACTVHQIIDSSVLARPALPCRSIRRKEVHHGDGSSFPLTHKNPNGAVQKFRRLYRKFSDDTTITSPSLRSQLQPSQLQTINVIILYGMPTIIQSSHTALVQGLQSLSQWFTCQAHLRWHPYWFYVSNSSVTGTRSMHPLFFLTAHTHATNGTHSIHPHSKPAQHPPLSTKHIPFE